MNPELAAVTVTCLFLGMAEEVEVRGSGPATFTFTPKP